MERKTSRVDPPSQCEYSFRISFIFPNIRNNFELNFLLIFIAKELDRTIRQAEKPIIATNQASSKPIAPVNPAPTALPPTELPLIREEPKLPEVHVPIKKYYGRKRDSQSSSSETELNYDETNATEKNK